MTWQASQQMEASNFAAAERSYRVILEEFPRDPVAKFMQKECEKRVTDLHDKTWTAGLNATRMKAILSFGEVSSMRLLWARLSLSLRLQGSRKSSVLHSDRGAVDAMIRLSNISSFSDDTDGRQGHLADALAGG